MASPPAAAPAASPASATAGSAGSAANPLAGGPPSASRDIDPAAPPTASQDTGPREAKPIRPIRPIPPASNRPKLPGVDDLGFDLPPAPGEPKKQAARAPDGKFAKGAPDAATPEPDNAEPATPASEEFVFGGETWRGEGGKTGRDIAEQSFKTLRGMHKANLQKIAEWEGKHKEAHSRAWELHRAYTALQAEVARLQAGHPPSATSPQSPSATPASAEVGGVDWALYSEIQRQATESGHPELAQAWLQQQFQEQLEARIKKALDEELRDVREDRGIRQIEQHGDALAEHVGSLVDGGGNQVYPEANDPQVMFEVGRTWREMGLNPEEVYEPSGRGLQAAILLYRSLHGERQPAATPQTPQPAAAQVPQASQDGGPSVDLSDATLDAGGAPFDRQPVSERNVPPQVKRLREAFAAPRQLTSLGFDR